MPQLWFAQLLQLCIAYAARVRDAHLGVHATAAPGVRCLFEIFFLDRDDLPSNTFGPEDFADVSFY